MVRPDSLGWRTVLMKERPGSLAYALYSSSDNQRPMAEIAATNGGETRGTANLAAGQWNHLATTYDGATLRLYVNGTQVSNRAISGAISSGALRIGGNAVWGEYFSGLIDEVRVYNRALTAGEIQLDMGRAVVASDSQPPTAPTGLAATVTQDDVRLTWGAASDNVGVTGYRVYRDGSLVTTLGGGATAYDDLDRAPGTYRYTVVAIDGAGLAGPASNEATATIAAADAEGPTPATLTATRTGNDVHLAWTESTDVSGVKEYRLYRDGALISTRTSRTFDDSDRPEATYRYKVVAVDNAGHTSPDSNVAEATIEPDTTAPTIFLAKCDGVPVYDEISLRPSFSDDRGPITVTLRLDGEIMRGPDNFAGDRGSFHFYWETRGLSNGPHVMTATARDAAGNEAVDQCEWIVHNPNVTVPITSHSDGDVISGNVTLTAEVLGDGEPLDRGALRVHWQLTPVGGGTGTS